MNKTVMVVVALVVLGVGALFVLMNRTSPTTNSTVQNSAMPSVVPTTATQATDSAAQAGMVKEFTVTSKGLVFDPKELSVKVGDRVRITYKNTMGQHDLTIDEFDVKTKLLKAGEQETVEFIANKAGSFEFYCSVPGHREGGMKGTLMVQ